jgi:hypothetical protein
MVTAAAQYVYWSLLVAGVVPPAVVTEILTGPAACAGEVATIWVVDLTVKALAVAVPNLTYFTVKNPVPVMVTEVPPATGPLVRESDVIDVPEP